MGRKTEMFEPPEPPDSWFQYEGGQMTDEKEFEEWYLSKFDAQHKLTTKEGWLEKGKRDREKVTKAVNHVLSYNLPYLAEERLKELLSEI